MGRFVGFCCVAIIFGQSVRAHTADDLRPFAPGQYDALRSKAASTTVELKAAMDGAK